MHVGGGDYGFEDELVAHIHFHVVFVTVVGLVVLLRPAGVEVFVGLDLGAVLEGLRDFARFDRGIVRTAVALPGHLGKTRIDHDALRGQREAVLLLQMIEEGVKETVDDRGVDERLAEVADGLPVGHRVARSQAEEGAKALAVGDLEAGGIVGQPVQALQHQHLEHEQRMKTPPASGPFGRTAHGGFDDGLEELPAHDFAHTQQGSLERGHVQVLDEIIEKSRVAVRNVIGHALACLKSPPRHSADLSFRECPKVE